MPPKRKRAVKVSVLVTAKDPQELRAKVCEPRQQNYPNFEGGATLGGTIAEGYNRAIRRAKGKVVVFAESDVVPLSKSQLKNLVKQVRPGEVVRGLEILPPEFNFSNTACFAEITKKFPLNKYYTPAKDAELYERLTRHGIPVRYFYNAGVVHLRRPGSKKSLKRAYHYGRAGVCLYEDYQSEHLENFVRYARHQIASGKACLKGVREERRVRKTRR